MLKQNYSHIDCTLKIIIKKYMPTNDDPFIKEDTNYFDEVILKIITPPTIKFTNKGLQISI